MIWTTYLHQAELTLGHRVQCAQTVTWLRCEADNGICFRDYRALWLYIWRQAVGLSNSVSVRWTGQTTACSDIHILTIRPSFILKLPLKKKENRKSQEKNKTTEHLDSDGNQSIGDHNSFTRTTYYFIYLQQGMKLNGAHFRFGLMRETKNIRQSSRRPVRITY
jgi:hypothetical protein